MPIKDREKLKAASLRYARIARPMTKEYINRLKAKPCTDCGIQYNPWVMEFDHRDPKLKVAVVSDIYIGNALTNPNTKKLDEEIAKCDLVCANCHRERTHKRKTAIPPR